MNDIDHNQIKAWILMILIIVCLVMCSCAKTIYVPVPGDTKTEYIVQERVDSLVMHDSVYIKEKITGDTVYIREYRYRDREHIVTQYDTICVSDTIRVPYEVEVKVAEMNGFQSCFFWLGISLVIALIAYILIKSFL